MCHQMNTKNSNERNHVSAKIIPLQDWLIVSTKKDPEKTTKTGIILLQNEDKNAQKLLVGKVVAAGPGKDIECSDGKIVVKPMQCKVNNVVLYSKYAKGTIQNEDDLQELNNVKDSDVVAIIKCE